MLLRFCARWWSFETFTPEGEGRVAAEPCHSSMIQTIANTVPDNVQLSIIDSSVYYCCCCRYFDVLDT